MKAYLDSRQRGRLFFKFLAACWTALSFMIAVIALAFALAGIIMFFEWLL